MQGTCRKIKFSFYAVSQYISYKNFKNSHLKYNEPVGK